uniref:SFRICE_009157 n=1 Tax=Spodoptera frugiperda TaxID=7108 RepID=A0A2H1W1R4_SPOFR
MRTADVIRDADAKNPIADTRVGNPIAVDAVELKDDIYEQPVNLMNKKSPHDKDEPSDVRGETNADPWTPFDFSKFDNYLNNFKDGDKQDPSPELNRIKRRARNVRKFSTLLGPQLRERPHHYTYPEPVKDRIMEFSTSTKKPGILPDQMNPGVIFRVRMSDAILRIKQRMYEDPERHIEADIIYTNLIKKVVMDEITKFHNLLLMYKTDKSIKEHLGECGGRIYKFISYMTIKVHIYCLFDALWIDGNPYVIGDEYSVTPVEVPPMLQCDAAECNSIVFVDSITEPKDVEEGDAVAAADAVVVSELPPAPLMKKYVSTYSG